MRLVNFDTAGTHFSTAGTHFSTAGIHFSTAGIHFSTAGIHFSTAGVHFSTVGIHFSTAGIHFDTAGVHFGTAGIHFNTAAIHFSTAGIHFDTAAIHFNTDNNSRLSKRLYFMLGTARFSERTAHSSEKKELIVAEHYEYLPQGEDDLVDWGDNFTLQLDEEGEALEVPKEETTAVKTSLNTFKVLHLKAKGPAKNSIVTAEKNAAKKEFIRLVREMVRFRFANPIITDAIRVQFGLHVKDPTHTPHGVPTTRPDFTLSDKDFRRLTVDFRDQDATSKAKPYGISGAVVSWSVLDHPPYGVEELTKAVLATRTPHILEFEDAERGKTVYVALQWQNNKGDKGPWSEILWAIVP